MRTPPFLFPVLTRHSEEPVLRFRFCRRPAVFPNVTLASNVETGLIGSPEPSRVYEVVHPPFLPGFYLGPRSGRRHFPHCSLVLRYPPLDATNPLIRVGYLWDKRAAIQSSAHETVLPVLLYSSATPGFRLALFLLPSYLANGFPYSVSPLVHRCTPRTLLLLCRRSPCRDCCRRDYSLDSAVFPPVFVLFKGSPALKTSGRGPRRFGRDRRSLLPLRFPRSAQQLHLCSSRWLFENAHSSPFGSACHDVADLFDGHALHVSIVFVHSLRQASPARTVLLPSKSWVPSSS